ncbi:MAG: Trm112 family protein [Rhodovibrionaceae bacterium]|nr:Trm112 family protein [Rhodovibrionaceae bacterium]
MTDDSGKPQEPATPRQGAGAGVDPKLLEILVCPLTKETLEYDRERQELISRKANLAYPVRDGIPIMLPDEARPLDD